MKVNLKKAVKKLAYGNIDFFRPLYEAIINSIQAEADEIKIEVNHYSAGDEQFISSYSVKDNGIGFTDENIESFLTLWTDKNSDKGALGSGRILCLKVFDNILVESQTKTNGNNIGKKINIDFNVDFQANDIDDNGISIEELDSSHSYTKVTYKNPTEKYQNKKFDMDNLKKGIFFNLLPLFIEYNNNNTNLTIKINDEVWLNAENIKSELSKYKFEEKEFELVGKNNIRKKFKLYYTISNDNNGNIKQFYAAAYRKIKEFSKIVKIEKLPNKASGTFCLVSDYFNDLVDDSRENFRLKENENNETDEFPIVFPNINKKLKETLNSIIIEKFPNIKDEFAKTKKKIINKKPYLRRYIDKFDDFTTTENDIEKEAEKQFNEQFGITKNKIEKFANEILKTKNFDKERYDEIVNNFTEVGQEQLAHYFAYRQTIIDMLKNIYETNLNSSNKFKEADIHDLIMPRNSKSDNYLSDIPKNNIWLFDDKFMTFNFAASNLEMKEIHKKIADENEQTMEEYEKDKPDLLILYSDQKNSDLVDAVIVEFKKIGVSKYEKSKALDQLTTYGKAVSESRKIGDIYTYAFVDFDDKFEELLQMRKYIPKALSKNGHNVEFYYQYINYENLNMHIYVLSFEQILRIADRRNRIFLDILSGKINE